MEEIRTKEEAENWFLKHSEGSVIVITPNLNKVEVDNYLDALKFLT